MRSLYKLKERGADQDLLREHVWVVWGRGDACQHDSYTCDTHPGATGWPTRRINTTDHNFFGAGGDNTLGVIRNATLDFKKNTSKSSISSKQCFFEFVITSPKIH